MKHKWEHRTGVSEPNGKGDELEVQTKPSDVEFLFEVEDLVEDEVLEDLIDDLKPHLEEIFQKTASKSFTSIDAVKSYITPMFKSFYKSNNIEWHEGVNESNGSKIWASGELIVGGEIVRLIMYISRAEEPLFIVNVKATSLLH
jgi:hypothetical protein